jgi:hypothetical protein
MNYLRRILKAQVGWRFVRLYSWVVAMIVYGISMWGTMTEPVMFGRFVASINEPKTYFFLFVVVLAIPIMMWLWLGRIVHWMSTPRSEE